jgi:hypothetical protein
VVSISVDFLPIAGLSAKAMLLDPMWGWNTQVPGNTLRAQSNYLSAAPSWRPL